MPGWAVSGFYGYLKGVSNELALRHVPRIEPRRDTLAGPLGRRGDQARTRPTGQEHWVQGLVELPGCMDGHDWRVLRTACPWG